MEYVVDSPLPPLECGIVLADLAVFVEDVPSLDFDRHNEAIEDGEGEVESGQEQDVSKPFAQRWSAPEKRATRAYLVLALAMF